MNNKASSPEPPSKHACHVDVQCFYADITVPSDKLFQKWAEETLQFLANRKVVSSKKFDLSILVVDKTDSQLLNNQYRHKNSPTNVLSFPFETPEIFSGLQQRKILGDIIACAQVIEMESQQQNKTTEQHWAHMLVHGVLHLLGYDHMNKDEADIMEILEVEILSQLGYQNPYMELIS